MPTRPIPAQESELPLPFPVRGIDLSQPFWSQPPGTTPVGQNVRAYDPGGARARGGSRPGLAKYVTGQLPGGGLVQDLNTVVAVGITAPGPPSQVVQVSAGGAGSAGSATDTFQLPVTAGNAILVLLGSNNSGSFPTVTDSLGNTYTLINSSSFSSFQAAAYLATSITGGAPTITAAVGTAFISLVCVEIPGVLGHESTSSPAGPGPSLAGVNWTASHAPDLMYAIVWSSPGASSATVKRTAGTGYTDLASPSVNFVASLKHLATNGSYGSDLAWSSTRTDQMQGLQGGIEVSA